MMKKMIGLIVLLTCITLSVVFVVNTNANVTEGPTQDYWIARHIADYLDVLMSEINDNELERMETYAHLTNDAIQHVERLWSLFLRNQESASELSRTENGNMLPNIVMIAAPEQGGQSTFMIAFDIMPTEEHIEYVLAYTGIPKERLSMGHMEFEAQIIPWEDMYRYHDAEECRSYESHIEPFSFNHIMGERIVIQDIGGLTLGHPTRTGAGFFTAPHRNFSGSRPAFTYPAFNRIGSLRWAYQTPQRDVGFVSTSPYGVFIDTVLPDMFMPITNFRGTAQAGMRVRSYRGWSGTQQDVWIFRANAMTSPLENKILTNPDSASRGGDSGAALIHIQGNNVSVLGTRRGVASFMSTNGISYIVGVYTAVRFYY